MSNTALAIRYVEAHANAVEQARLAYLLSGKRPDAATVATLLAGQRADGGWPPFWAEDYSSLDATCFRLAQAEQLGIPYTRPELIHALAFLAGRQAPDGSWEEEPGVAGLAPPWATPGDRSACLYLTANCAFWLALAGAHEQAAAGAAFLQAALQADGSLPGFPHTQWLAGGLWHRLKWEEPAGQVCRYLLGRLDDLAASNLAWLITTLCAAGVPALHPLVSAAAARLEQRQEADGRWQSEDGPGRDVHATLEALRALRLSARA